MKLFKPVVSLIVLLVFVFIGGCGRKEETPPPTDTYTREEAQTISHVTSGTLSPSGEIAVTFVRFQVEDNQVGVPLDKKIFKCNPGIDGVTRWKNRSTLAFKPNKKLALRKSYTVNVHYNRLIPAYKDAKPLMFTFNVAGREVTSFEGDFELSEPGNPNLLYYRGVIAFTEPLDMETVKNAVIFYQESEAMVLQWQEKEKGKTFEFKTGDIRRSNKSTTFALTVSKDKTEISQDFNKKFTLEPLQKLKVVDVRKFDQGKTPGLEVKFSDLLDPQQDITGLVRLEPAIKFDTKTVGSSVFLTGNFAFGSEYTVKVSGIRSKWGTVLEKETTREVEFQDRKPRMAFLGDGLFMPSINEKKLGFKTINVRKVKLTVKKVFESNLGQFLQVESIKAGKSRSERYYDYDVRRVGVTVAEKELMIGEKKNQWLTHLLDLQKLVPAGEKGIFLLTITFKREDMLFQGLKKKASYYYGREYYSNPNSYGYLNRNGYLVKPVIFSDIGLTYKQGTRQHVIFATHLPDAAPMKGVNVTLRTYQNQVVASAVTDSQGKAVFDQIKETVFYIEGEKDGQRSMIKPADMRWNLSTFDTGGAVVKAQETRAYIYTDRGVYRPGDAIFLSLIARNRDNTFPENHPVTLKIYNPRNQLVLNRTVNKGTDGFYSFTFSTKSQDPTGNWQARVVVGSQTFYHTLKIETVVPNRLKVNIEPIKKILTAADRLLKFDLSSNYLFGAPAANLKAEVKLTLNHRVRKFKKYHGFIFNNQSVKFKPVEATVFNSSLDAQGQAVVRWQMPPLTYAPSAVRARISAKVFEKGGRFTRMDEGVDIEPFDVYVGLEKPKFTYGYGQVGEAVPIRAIAVDTAENAVAGRQLKYKIYRNNRYWWWEYDSRESFKLRYKKDKYTRLVKEGELVTKAMPQKIEFIPEERGEYLIEVTDTAAGGHGAGFFFSAYYWGDTPADIDTAGSLVLKADRKVYKPGDTASVSFPAPPKGTVLMAVEKADEILHSMVYDANPDQSGEQRVTFTVTEAMLPNAYVAISILQPLEQENNDRPLRTYGVIPIMVEDPVTRRGMRIKMTDRLRPNQPFEIDIETADQKPTQFTVAVVDEGLLDLTRFRTPDPWKEFFKKQKLGVLTSDLFGYVLGVNRGDIFKLFSIGGGMEADDYRKSQMEPGKEKRFKPVAMFKGPLMTDESGKANVKFDMPDYIGSVRVMVVAADGRRYGNAEKAVPVKSELMVMPTLPRVLGPGDKIILPVSVFAMEDNIKDVTVSVKTEGPLQVTGVNKKELTFEAVGEKDLFFTLAVPPAAGSAAVTVEAKSGRYKAVKRTAISIRPYSPRIYSSETKECLPGDKVSVIIPDRGIQGTNRATVRVMRRPNLKLGHRLSWLIRYPYGCIEQTTSAVFPQLYLKEFLKQSSDGQHDIDANINEAIKRLRRFQLPSGGFAYWPGHRYVNIWGTNYAGHFLVEARKLGYHVPEDMFTGWKRFQKSRALVTSDHIRGRVYRLYVLAMAGDPQIGPMNLLKENHLKEMYDTDKWMLAAAYHLAGSKDTASNILKSTGVKVMEYWETGGTYGSHLRDMGIILEVMTMLEDWNKADRLYEDIIAEIAGDGWYSTQTLGYSLLAVGKYIRANEGDFRQEKPKMAGYIKLPSGKKIPFDTGEISFSQRLDAGFGKNLQVYLDKKTNLKRGFVVLEWDGVPLEPDVKEVSKNLWLKVEWLDQNGMLIDPGTIRQGTTFWGHFTVGRTTYTRRVLEELALVQILPSGWEIENIRLLKEAVPQWMRKWKLNREEYLDIRDDRVMWFFDFPIRNDQFDFVVKLNAVTAGEFILPPTLFEAMYDNKYKAIKPGKAVKVMPR